MSKPRYKWWGYIKNVIRAYPSLKQEYEALHEQSITPSMSGMPGGGGTSRAVENIAIRELPSTEQKEYEAVRRAIETTKIMPNGDNRLKIIKMTYWGKPCMKLEDAGDKVGYQYKTARKINGEFIKLVAQYYGYDLRDEKWNGK